MAAAQRADAVVSRAVWDGETRAQNWDCRPRAQVVDCAVALGDAGGPAGGRCPDVTRGRDALTRAARTVRVGSPRDRHREGTAATCSVETGQSLGAAPRARAG